MKTLVMYGSKYGATEICAKKIAQKLGAGVDLVNLKSQKEVALAKYDTIIVGSSIYAGQMRKEVRTYIKAHESELAQKKIGIFLSCFDEKAMGEYIEKNIPQTIRQQVKGNVCCGGALYFEKMNFLEKFLLKQISKTTHTSDRAMPEVDGKNNVNMISEDKINHFVTQMKQM